MIEYKVVLCDGFNSHKLKLELDQRLFGVDAMVTIMDSFAKEIIECDCQVVTDHDIMMALESGRRFFYFEAWLVDIYAVGV